MDGEGRKRRKRSAHHTQVVKLRKKLQQIENLELLDRNLTEQERIKISKKNEFREELQSMLKRNFPDEVDIMKRPGDEYTNEPDDKRTRKIEEEEDEAEIDDNSTSAEEEPDKTPSQKIKELEKVDRKPVNVPQTPKECTKPKKEKLPWRDTNYKVFTLAGHHDIVLDVDYADGYVLSASRDTTVRVWQVGNIEEERSLRGHRACVTSVSFLPGELAATVQAKIESEFEEGQESPECRVLAVSGGLDCTLKVWDIISGESHGSIYTYNGITCLACGPWGVVTGTEGGKLEVWNLVTGQRIAFVNAFEAQVISLDVKEDTIHAGSAEGELGVWKLDLKRRTLATIYLTEPESVIQVRLRQLACLAAHEDTIYLGDSGPNIKKFNWKKSDVTRLKNHIGEVGMTDSLTITPDGLLFSASYYIDVGYPSINIRNLKNDEYVCSLISQGEGRYLCMCASKGIIVTGGHELKVWVHGASGTSPRKITGIETVRPSFLRRMLGPAEDTSDDETDWPATTDDEDSDGTFRQGSQDTSIIKEESSWWCTIV